MKRKISLLLSILTLAFVLTGCVTKEEVAYDEETLQESCKEVVSLVSGGQISEEQLLSLSDWNQGYFLASLESQIGVQMDMDTLVTAIQGWEASLEECGEFVAYSDFTFEATPTSLTATAPAKFSERTADLELTFDEDLKLESVTVSADYSIGEILEKAGLNTVLGMGTVFVVLIFMSFIISLLKYIPMLMDKMTKKEAAPAEAVQPEIVETEEVVADDTELIAVIAAAIAAAEGTSTDGFVVRSIKRRTSNKWSK